ncbi:hypothetical protein ONZ45_g9293 [Pleurotus djamor]|nr:hypothetical protein ONZ45_g9293 [Pleurotus djamor]
MAEPENEFDVVVVGTDLAQSILAAALSKAGIKVAHIDPNPYYGADNASLNLDELVRWADSADPTQYWSIIKSDTIPPDVKRYSISLTPAVIPSIGPHVTSLVASGVARYGGFKLVQPISVCSTGGQLQNVPGSKEDIFRNSSISLLDKRRLMRFLMFAASEFEEKTELQGKEDMPFQQFLESVFSLNHDLSNVICFALAHAVAISDPTLPALTRIRRYLRSHGRYGPSSFIVGQYGGAGEIAQGFCRTSAVHGGVYILGRRVKSVVYEATSPTSSEEPTLSHFPYSIELDDFPEALKARILIASADDQSLPLPPSVPSSPVVTTDTSPHAPIARCIAIFDRPITFPTAQPTQDPSETEGTEAEPETRSETREMTDAAAVIYPPASIDGASDTSAATVIVMGEGTMSTPKDRWIVYIMLPMNTPATSPQELLNPYLTHLASLTSPPGDASSPILFKLFYAERTPSPLHLTSNSSDISHSVIRTPSPTVQATEFFDSATSIAESVFWQTIKALRSTQRPGDANPVVDIESFWPPVDQSDGDDDNEDW